MSQTDSSDHGAIHGVGLGMRSPALALVATLCGVLYAGCLSDEVARDAGGVVESDVPRVHFEDVFEATDTIHLEENASTINVAPFVTADRGGRYLVADAKEAQVRLYAPSGELVSAWGRRGRGPGEMQNPVGAARLPDGTILVSDVVNGMLRYDTTSYEVVDQMRSPVSLVYGVDALPDGSVLVTGQTASDPEVGLVHRWTYGRETVSETLLEAGGHAAPRIVQSAFGWADVDVFRDTVFAVSGLADTLYVYDVDGELLERRWLPFDGFSHRFDVEKLAALRAGTSGAESDRVLYRIFSVHRLADGRFVVQFSNRVGMESKWHWLLLDAGRTPRAEVRNAPQLLTSRGDELLIDSPAVLPPNVWIRGRLADEYMAPGDSS